MKIILEKIRKNKGSDTLETAIKIIIILAIIVGVILLLSLAIKGSVATSSSVVNAQTECSLQGAKYDTNKKKCVDATAGIEFEVGESNPYKNSTNNHSDNVSDDDHTGGWNLNINEDPNENPDSGNYGKIVPEGGEFLVSMAKVGKEAETGCTYVLKDVWFNYRFDIDHMNEPQFEVHFLFDNPWEAKPNSSSVDISTSSSTFSSQDDWNDDGTGKHYQFTLRFNSIEEGNHIIKLNLDGAEFTGYITVLNLYDLSQFKGKTKTVSQIINKMNEDGLVVTTVSDDNLFSDFKDKDEFMSSKTGWTINFDFANNSGMVTHISILPSGGWAPKNIRVNKEINESTVDLY